VVSASLKPHKNQWLCSANKFCFDERFDVKDAKLGENNIKGCFVM